VFSFVGALGGSPKKPKPNISAPDADGAGMTGKNPYRFVGLKNGLPVALAIWYLRSFFEERFFALAQNDKNYRHHYVLD
jgi:hypothetical protein